MGKLVQLDILDLAFDGKAVAHLNGKVVFLDAGLPGETVLAELTRSKPHYSQAIVRDITKKSGARIDAVCSHFEHCGGCTWQDLVYKQQLEYKKKQVAECIARIGGLETVAVHDTIGADDVFHYRNKMEFSFHVTGQDEFHLGLHRRGRYDDIFDLQTCHLQSEAANKIVQWVREFVRNERIPVYDINSHVGFMRFLVIREARATGQIMVLLVTNYGEMPAIEKLVKGLTGAVPEVTTIVHGQNSKKANIAVPEIERVLSGSGIIEEHILGCRFRVSATSFLQTNSRQAEVLYRTAFDLLQPKTTDRLLDLYCGAGTIGILLAPEVAEVVGVELVPAAVKAAQENAELNQVTNAHFVEDNVKNFLASLPEEERQFDVVVIDPPRAGLHPKALKRVLELKPPKLLYISCNPATFARDAKEMCNAGYTLPEAQPVDMFPHTRHIELIGLFHF